MKLLLRAALLALLLLSSVASQPSQCDEYLACRNELLEMHWKCAEPARRLTQHACRINDLFGEHKMTTYASESVFVTCVSRDVLREEDNSFEVRNLRTGNCDSGTTPSAGHQREYSRINCWSDVVRLTQKCYSLARCCPAVSNCGYEVEESKLGTKIIREKRKIRALLEECREGMLGVLKSPIAKEDAYIAREVLHSAQELLTTVLPFRLQTPPAEKKAFAHATSQRKGVSMKELVPFKRSHPVLNNLDGVVYHRYGISKPKFGRRGTGKRTIPYTVSKTVEEFEVQIEKPDVTHSGFTGSPRRVFMAETSRRPFFISSLSSPSSLRTSTAISTSFASVDRDATLLKPWHQTNSLKKVKKHRKRKRKRIDYHHRSPALGSITNSKTKIGHKIKKLEKIAKSLKHAEVPKILMVKQRQGRLLGYGQPHIAPISTPVFPSTDRTSIDDIYDEILESQSKSTESKSIEDTSGDNLVSLGDSNAFPLPKWTETGVPDFEPSVTPQTDVGAAPSESQTHPMEAFISNSGTWTMEPMEPSSHHPTTTFFPISSSTEVFTSPPTTVRTTTEEPISATTSTEATSTNGGWKEVEVATFNPLEDYVTSGFLEKDLKGRPLESELPILDHADYIDISADIDIVPKTSLKADHLPPPPPLDPPSFEFESSTPSWPQSNDVNTPDLVTEASPLEPQEKVLPMLELPEFIDVFGANEATPSPLISTTPFDNQLWPLPIVKKARALGAAMMRSLPINVFKNAKKTKRKSKTSGCKSYGKCLMRASELQKTCRKPSTTTYDTCSEQLVPLYKLIDAAADEKQEFIAQCVGNSTISESKKCTVTPKSWRNATCDDLPQLELHCRDLSTCCSSRKRCDLEAAGNRVGTRLQLLERSFSLRAASCKFRHVFNRQII